MGILSSIGSFISGVGSAICRGVSSICSAISGTALGSSLGNVVSKFVSIIGVAVPAINVINIVNAILADKRKRKYVWIPPEMVEDAWVTSLRMENSFAFIKIEDVPKSYYETVFEALLSNTEYELSKAASELKNKITFR